MNFESHDTGMNIFCFDYLRGANGSLHAGKLKVTSPCALCWSDV